MTWMRSGDNARVKEKVATQNNFWGEVVRLWTYANDVTEFFGVSI